MARHDFEQSLQQDISDPYQQASTISSLPFSCLICAKRRSRWPRFDTSHYTPVTFLPISLTATANSGSRRSVMKTYAPSFTNRFAVARPMPLLPPVSQCVFFLQVYPYISPQWSVQRLVTDVPLIYFCTVVSESNQKFMSCIQSNKTDPRP